MNEKIYSVNELIKEHDQYEFKLVFDSKTKVFTADVKIPINLLFYGIAYTMANMDLNDTDLIDYINNISEEAIKIRKERDEN